MVGRFRGIFRKWYCPHCNKVISWEDTKYEEEFMGYYTNCWHVCELCGYRGVMTLKERLEQVAKTKQEPRRHKVITLCGSTRFQYEFIKVQKELTLQGNIVISLGLFSKADEETLSDETCKMLSEVHKSRIDLSDEIFVINRNQYIGEDTKEEIEYAISKDKKVNYLETPISWKKYDSIIDVTSK